MIKLLRKILISIVPNLAEKFGNLYANLIVPLLPVSLCSISKKIGHYGPFRFHPRFLFREFESWGREINCDFETLIDACRGKKCVFDLGAHIGLYTMPLSSVIAPEGRVYAFEPANTEFSYLKWHIKLNKLENVSAENILMGKKTAEKIEFYEYDNESGMSSISTMAAGGKKTFKKQVTIDGFSKEKGLKPDVIKIDVEGAEFDVLEGGMETLKSCRPVIFISLHPYRLEALGKKESDFYNILKCAGYRFCDIAGNETGIFKSGEYLLKPI